MPQRYSRHYYDLYRMAQTQVKDVAFSHIDLLKTVVDFKMKFYPRAWAKYPEATPGTLKLIPPEYRFPALISDYEAMKDMLYGDIPSFDTIIESVRQLEKHSLAWSTRRLSVMSHRKSCMNPMHSVRPSDGCLMWQTVRCLPL